jgi:hypothetical protein
VPLAPVERPAGAGKQIGYAEADDERDGDRDEIEFAHLRWYRRKEIRYFILAIVTMLPFACGSFTTVTYNSFSPSLKATLVLRLAAVCATHQQGQMRVLIL